MEVSRERDARKLAFEVGCVAGAIFGVVEEGLSGVEDVVAQNAFDYTWLRRTIAFLADDSGHSIPI